MHVNRATIDPHNASCTMDKRCLGARQTLSRAACYFCDVGEGVGGGNVSTFHDEDLRGFRNERKGNLFILHLCEEKNSRKGAKREFASVRGKVRVAKLKGIKDKSRRRD